MIFGLNWSMIAQRQVRPRVGTMRYGGRIFHLLRHEILFSGVVTTTTVRRRSSRPGRTWLQEWVHACPIGQSLKCPSLSRRRPAGGIGMGLGGNRTEFANGARQRNELAVPLKIHPLIPKEFMDALQCESRRYSNYGTRYGGAE